MLNPEFAELVKVGKTYYNGQANENSDIAVMENRAGTLALKAMQIINELKRNWTDDSMPTCVEKKRDESIFPEI